jgi:hypothetical protein
VKNEKRFYIPHDRIIEMYDIYDKLSVSKTLVEKYTVLEEASKLKSEIFPELKDQTVKFTYEDIQRPYYYFKEE